MILLSAALERYHISQARVQQLKDGSGHRYNVINMARKDCFDREYPRTVKFVDEIAKDHRCSQAVISALVHGDAPEKVHKYLLTCNACNDAVDQGSCRTLVLLDATYSMQPVLNLAKQTVNRIFKRAFECVEASDGKVPTGMEMKMGVYRNFNVDEDLIVEMSDWESSPAKLFQFLTTVPANGGWGHEAVELALHDALKDHQAEPIGQIIIIGDAPPNTRADSDYKRVDSGLTFAQYPNPTYFDDQHAAVVAAGIVVHTFFIPTQVRTGHFYPVPHFNSTLVLIVLMLRLHFLSLQGDASWKNSFHNMAGNGGKSFDLDLSSSQAEDNLVAAITLRILDAYGGGGEHSVRLLSEYEQKFGGFGYT